MSFLGLSAAVEQSLGIQQLNSTEVPTSSTNNYRGNDVRPLLYSGEYIDLVSDSDDDEEIIISTQQENLHACQINHGTTVDSTPHLPKQLPPAFIKIEGANESMVLAPNNYAVTFIPDSVQQNAVAHETHCQHLMQENYKTEQNYSQQDNLGDWESIDHPLKPIITSIVTLNNTDIDPLANNAGECIATNYSGHETSAATHVSSEMSSEVKIGRYDEMVDDGGDGGDCDYGRLEELPDNVIEDTMEVTTDTADEGDEGDRDESEDEDEDETTQDAEMPEISSEVADVIDLNNSDVDSDAEENPTSRHPAEQFAQFFCPECDVAIGNYLQFKEHTDKEHQFHKIEHLKMQVIIGKDGNLCYKCKDCIQKFPLKTYYKTLYDHRISHLNQPDYIKCRLCEKRFKKFIYLIAHLRNLHRKLYHPRPRTSTVLNNIRYFCPVCNHCSQKKKDWHMHLELVHDYDFRFMDKVEKIPNKKEYKCLKCKKKVSAYNVLSHGLEHEKYKAFECKLCDSYVTNSLPCIRQHVSRHLGHKRFCCNYCEAKFDAVKAFQKHQLKKHNVPLLSCPVCERIFKTSQSLQTHFKKSNHIKLK